MIQCQKDLFELEDHIKYINGAYMSPQLKEVTKIGVDNLKLKSRPYQFSQTHFFEQVIELKKVYAELLQISDWQNIAIIPSVSYGLANAAQTIKPDGKKKIIIIAEQFPSNFYIWDRYAKMHGLSIEIISSPHATGHDGTWTEHIIQAIDQDTLLIAMSHTHWADGTLYDLKTIRRALDKHQGYLIIDGTQSFGALPYNQSEVKADILVASSYKWLMGPYSIGMAYYGDHLCHAEPIELSWLNRLHSQDFKNLVNYQDTYKPKAHRYDMGEAPNFINVPMATSAAKQLISWGADHIQEYCHYINKSALNRLEEHGFVMNQRQERAHHLFGIKVQDPKVMAKAKELLEQHHVIVSYRGDSIRVSPNVYNTMTDMDTLADLLIEASKSVH